MPFRPLDHKKKRGCRFDILPFNDRLFFIQQRDKGFDVGRWLRMRDRPNLFLARPSFHSLPRMFATSRQRLMPGAATRRAAKRSGSYTSSERTSDSSIIVRPCAAPSKRVRRHTRLIRRGMPRERLWISALALSEKIGVGLPA